MKWPIKNVFLLPTLLAGLAWLLVLPGLATAQTFKVLHSFSPSSAMSYDGTGPGNLIISGDTLYGTAWSGGGMSGYSTVFKMNLDGTSFVRFYGSTATSSNNLGISIL